MANIGSNDSSRRNSNASMATVHSLNNTPTTPEKKPNSIFAVLQSVVTSRKSDAQKPHEEEKKPQEEGTKSTALECNICYDEPAEPVTTHCGHIYW